MKALLILLIVWGIAASFVNLHHVFLPEPLGVLQSLWSEIINGKLLDNFLMTFGRVFAGLLVGIGLGAPLGILIGISKRVRKQLLPLIEIFRSIPTSMLFPVFIVVFGIGEIAKLVIVASATFPIMVISTFTGMAERKENQDRRDYLELHKGVLSWKIKVLALIWNALPSIIGGLKVSISIALVLTIVTEMFFIASSGVGWAANQAYQAFNLDEMYMYIFAVGLIGLGINLVFDKLVGKFFKTI
ncbi:ABC transporter permease [Candidatus Wolfebacteria bacterium]|nr:ABC transporter permease [Candidatus Wolfebacteria bacterium]